MKLWRKLTGGSVLVLLFLFSLIPTNPTSAAPSVAEPRGILAMSLINPPAKEVCSNTILPISIFVIDTTNAYHPPEENVWVTVMDGTYEKIQKTNNLGMARLLLPLKLAGPLELTVSVQKDGYTSPAPMTLNYEIIDCRWSLKTSFLESYYVINTGDAKLVVGAKTNWEAELYLYLDKETKILKASEAGQYQFFTSTLSTGTATASLYPSPLGEYSIKIHESSFIKNGRIILDLVTVPVTYPATVTLNVENAGSYRTKVPESAPVATHPGKGRFLELNKVALIDYPISGGYDFWSAGKCVYFCASKPEDQHYYFLSILLIPIKAKAASIPDSLLLALSGDLP